jgi:hypothetical protein
MESLSEFESVGGNKYFFLELYQEKKSHDFDCLSFKPNSAANSW